MLNRFSLAPMQSILHHSLLLFPGFGSIYRAKGSSERVVHLWVSSKTFSHSELQLNGTLGKNMWPFSLPPQSFSILFPFPQPSFWDKNGRAHVSRSDEANQYICETCTPQWLTSIRQTSQKTRRHKDQDTGKSRRISQAHRDHIGPLPHVLSQKKLP